MLNKVSIGRSKNKAPAALRSQSQVSQLTNSCDLARSDSLTDVLQTTLEPHRLLSVYAGYISDRLSIAALQFISEDEIFNLLGDFQGADFQHAVMLYADNDYLGQLIYQFKRPISTSLKSQLEAFHRQLTFPLRNALTFSQVQRTAVRDHLTGLGNRGLLEEVLDHLHVKQQREESGVHSLMILDLDGFKEVNDEFGHHQGDSILKLFAELLKSTLRDSDQVFRFGGDEFVVVMENTDQYQAEGVYQRVNKALFNCKVLTSFNLSISAGTAQLESFLTVEQTMEQADQHLYQAKHGGKNRHCSLTGCS